MITKLLNRLADILIKPIMEAIEAIQGDRADFNDITCVRNRACRLTKEDALKEKIENIKRGDAATLPTDNQAICMVCRIKEGKILVYGDTLVCSIECREHYIAEKEAIDADTQAVTETNVRKRITVEDCKTCESDTSTYNAGCIECVKESNIKAAESVKNPRHEPTKKACKASIGILEAAEFGERIGREEE